MTVRPYTVPIHTRLLRIVLRPIFRGVFHLLSDVRIVGRENVPRGGAYLIAVNHVSLFDPPFLLAFWPIAPEAAGAVDIWDRPGQSLLARLYGGVPVHRGEYDRQLVEALLGALQAGRPVMIAPEGGRSHQTGMRRALPGAAYLVEKTAVQLVPVGIVGTTDDFLKRALHGQRPRIEMRIGQPVRLPLVEGKGTVRHLARQRSADQIMLLIASLLPSEYRGVYSSGFPIDDGAEGYST